MKSALNGLSLQHYITKRLKKDHQRISRLRPYENQYNWKGVEFPVSIKKIDKPWHSSKHVVQQERSKEIYIYIYVYIYIYIYIYVYIYTVRRSQPNVKCKKEVNLLMIEDGEKWHYTSIKSISRLLGHRQ